MDNQMKEVHSEELQEKQSEIDLLKLKLDHDKALQQKEQEIYDLLQQQEHLPSFKEQLSELHKRLQLLKHLKALILLNVLLLFSTGVIIYGMVTHRWFRYTEVRDREKIVEKIVYKRNQWEDETRNTIGKLDSIEPSLLETGAGLELSGITYSPQRHHLLSSLGLLFRFEDWQQNCLIKTSHCETILLHLQAHINRFQVNYPDRPSFLKREDYQHMVNSLQKSRQIAASTDLHNLHPGIQERRRHDTVGVVATLTVAGLEFYRSYDHIWRSITLQSRNGIVYDNLSASDLRVQSSFDWGEVSFWSRFSQKK